MNLQGGWKGLCVSCQRRLLRPRRTWHQAIDFAAKSTQLFQEF